MKKIKEIKCPNCHKSDKVYPSNNKEICDYICLNCYCLFDKKRKKIRAIKEQL